MPCASFTKVSIDGERENKQTDKDKRDFTIVLGSSMMYGSIVHVQLSIDSQISEILLLVVAIKSAHYDFERNVYGVEYIGNV